MISSRGELFEEFIKGRRDALMRDGVVQEEAMHKAEVSPRNWHAARRLNAQLDDANEGRLSSLERNGEISVLQKRPADRVLELESAEEMQRIPIELV